MTKCVICDQRPKGLDNGFCHICGDKIDASTRKYQPQKPKHYLSYRGAVVGLFPNGDGELTPRLLNINPARLPKSRTVNLDVYCEGYERETIKRFKSCILQLANK